MRYLLEAGADPNGPGTSFADGSIPLLALACSNETELNSSAAAEVIRLLLEHGAGIKATTADGYNVMHAAAVSGHSC